MVLKGTDYEFHTSYWSSWWLWQASCLVARDVNPRATFFSITTVTTVSNVNSSCCSFSMMLTLHHCKLFHRPDRCETHFLFSFGQILRKTVALNRYNPIDATQGNSHKTNKMQQFSGTIPIKEEGEIFLSALSFYLTLREGCTKKKKKKVWSFAKPPSDPPPRPPRFGIFMKNIKF